MGQSVKNPQLKAIPENIVFLLTFLNHEYSETGGLASARHLSVTFSRSARVTIRLGSSLARCTDTVGASKFV